VARRLFPDGGRKRIFTSRELLFLSQCGCCATPLSFRIFLKESTTLFSPSRTGSRPAAPPICTAPPSTSTGSGSPRSPLSLSDSPASSWLSFSGAAASRYFPPSLQSPLLLLFLSSPPHPLLT